MDAVDWDNITPHPELAALAELCAACGHDRGEHMVDTPHACEATRTTALVVRDHYAHRPCSCKAFLASTTRAAAAL